MEQRINNTGVSIHKAKQTRMKDDCSVFTFPQISVNGHEMKQEVVNRRLWSMLE